VYVGSLGMYILGVMFDEVHSGVSSRGPPFPIFASTSLRALQNHLPNAVPDNILEGAYPLFPMHAIHHHVFSALWAHSLSSSQPIL